MRVVTARHGKLQTVISEVVVSHNRNAVRTGLTALDRICPGNALATGAIHELLFVPGRGLPLFFAAFLARRLFCPTQGSGFGVQGSVAGSQIPPIQSNIENRKSSALRTQHSAPSWRRRLARSRRHPLPPCSGGRGVAAGANPPAARAAAGRSGVGDRRVPGLSGREGDGGQPSAALAHRGPAAATGGRARRRRGDSAAAAWGGVGGTRGRHTLAGKASAGGAECSAVGTGIDSRSWRTSWRNRHSGGLP